MSYMIMCSHVHWSSLKGQGLGGCDPAVALVTVVWLLSGMIEGSY